VSEEAPDASAEVAEPPVDAPKDGGAPEGGDAPPGK